MKKFLITVLSVLFWTSNSFTAEEKQEELNVFGYPDKTVVKIIERKDEVVANDVVLPNCDDEKLIAQVKEDIKPYLKNEENIVINKRKNKLIIKNLANFSEVTEDSLKLNENKAAVAGVVETKINKNLGHKKLRICKSDNPIMKTDLYLLIYEHDGKINIDVVNFIPNQTPSFKFKDK